MATPPVLYKDWIVNLSVQTVSANTGVWRELVLVTNDNNAYSGYGTRVPGNSYNKNCNNHKNVILIEPIIL